MARSAIIGLLIILIVTVWSGPLKSLASHHGIAGEPEMTLRQAELLANDGEVAAAYRAYRILVAQSPENPTYHYHFGVFCLVHERQLVENGWSRDNIVRTALYELEQARALAPHDHETALHYAVFLLDDGFFGDVVTREHKIEAWQQVLHLVRTRYESDPGWDAYPFAAANSLIQLARIEASYENPAEARAYLARAREAVPTLRPPQMLLALDQTTAD